MAKYRETLAFLEALSPLGFSANSFGAPAKDQDTPLSYFRANRQWAGATRM